MLPESGGSWYAELIVVVIAAVGGTARYLDKTLRGLETYSPLRLLSSAFVAGFSGYMTAQVFGHWYPDWIMVAAGVGGYMGTQAMDSLSEVVQVLLKKKSE